MKSYDSPRTILCDDCSDTAVEYDAGVCVEQLEGKESACLGCRTPGRIYLIEDDGHGYLLRFGPLSQPELEERADDRCGFHAAGGSGRCNYCERDE